MGLLGNQDALTDYYPWMNTYNLDASYPLGGALQSGYYQKAYKLSSISWEKSRTWGLGFDATVNNKINVTFDYYDRRTTGIIMDVPVPAEFGLDAYKDNVGEMSNRGVEVILSYNNKWGLVVWCNRKLLVQQKRIIGFRFESGCRRCNG